MIGFNLSKIELFQLTYQERNINCMNMTLQKRFQSQQRAKGEKGMILLFL